MNTDMLIRLLEAGREGQVFNLAKKSLLDKYDCLHDTRGDYCFFTPKNSQKIMPLMLVAHVDTVNRSGKKVKVVEDNGVFYNKNGVLGADDRAGVFIILELVKQLDALPYILLTNHEEIGGIGVSAFCESKILDPYLSGINLFVEFDRHGINQYVTYSKIPADLETFFENYGYENHFGSYSDVATLSRHYKIAHVNLSAGYFNEHTAYEYCSLAGIQFAITNALTVLPRIKKQHFTEEKVYNWTGYSSYKPKKGKKSTTSSVYGSYDDYWMDKYDANTGVVLDDLDMSGVHIDMDEPVIDVTECPFCGSIHTSEIDYDLRYCSGCGDYFSEADCEELQNLKVGIV